MSTRKAKLTEKQKKEQNRISSQNVRARNKQRMLDQENEIASLKLQVRQLQALNRKLRLSGVVTIGPDDTTESL